MRSGLQGSEIYYSRQTILPEIGQQGQLRLAQARALVIGAGGLGSPALQYLAGAGVGEITILDGDLVDESNLHRQTLFSHQELGQNKALVAKSRLMQQNPYIKIKALPNRLDTNNAKELIEAVDIVFDCSDNFATKFLIHDLCFALRRDLVLASIYQWEGQLQIFNFSNPQNDQACYRCLWPTTPEAGCVDACVESGVLGAVAGTLGVMQALEGLKLLLGIEGLKQGESLIFDLKQFSMKRLKWKRVHGCKVCGGTMTDHDILQSATYAPEFEFHIDEKFPRLREALWVDIRSHQELTEKPYDFGAKGQHMPMDEFDPESFDASEHQTIIIVCDKGIRSFNLTQQLRAMGYDRFYSYAPGVSGLIQGADLSN